MKRNAMLERLEAIDAADGAVPPETDTTTWGVGGEPHPVHRDVMALIDWIMREASDTRANDDAAYGILLRSLRILKPRIARELVTVDPVIITTWLHALGRELLAVGAQAALPPPS